MNLSGIRNLAKQSIKNRSAKVAKSTKDSINWDKLFDEVQEKYGPMRTDVKDLDTIASAILHRNPESHSIRNVSDDFDNVQDVRYTMIGNTEGYSDDELLQPLFDAQYKELARDYDYNLKDQISDRNNKLSRRDFGRARSLLYPEARIYEDEYLPNYNRFADDDLPF